MVLSACAAEPPKPAPAASAGPSIPAGRNLARQASAFESYMRRAGAIDPAFARPADVSNALMAGAGHEPRDLEAGMVAYGALAALKETKFVAAVREDTRGAGLSR